MPDPEPSPTGPRPAASGIEPETEACAPRSGAPGPAPAALLGEEHRPGARGGPTRRRPGRCASPGRRRTARRSGGGSGPAARSSRGLRARRGSASDATASVGPVGADPAAVRRAPDQAQGGELVQPALHRPPAPALGEQRAVAQDVVQVRRGGDAVGMPLVVGGGAADPGEVDARRAGPAWRSRCPRRRSPGSRSQNPPTRSQTDRGDREGQGPEQPVVAAALPGARRRGGPAGWKGWRSSRSEVVAARAVAAAGRPPGRRAASGGSDRRPRPRSGPAVDARQAVDVEEDQQLGAGGQRCVGAGVAGGGQRQSAPSRRRRARPWPDRGRSRELRIVHGDDDALIGGRLSRAIASLLALADDHAGRGATVISAVLMPRAPAGWRACWPARPPPGGAAPVVPERPVRTVQCCGLAPAGRATRPARGQESSTRAGTPTRLQLRRPWSPARRNGAAAGSGWPGGGRPRYRRPRSGHNG